MGSDEQLQVQHFYRAMDFLLEHTQAIEKEVYVGQGTGRRRYVIAYNPQ
jgi:ABC-type tungstate transport system permease subunit